ncbi:sensor histidine kinase [Rubrivivax gelatinosus]|uniref:sensor histidine kinase n=1 Tax=Rubrivivax gelatinosus TaxID=28068 RepID=UPI0002DF029E|nr:ATP-binding protein [Rubrivivax gelatinosus]MBG6082149.1 PAS domain S-box-containing protein [Rubrivivax gelatinosus]
MLPRWTDPRRSLRARFALLLGGSGLALALVTAAVVGIVQRGQLVEQQGYSMRREALLLARVLDGALRQRLEQLQATADQPLLASGLFDPGDARLLLEGLRAQQPAFAWIAIVAPDGQVRVATNALLEGTDLQAEPWFAPAAHAPWIGSRRPAGALTASLGLVDGQPPQLIDMGLPMTDTAGRTTGVLVARLRWDWLRELHRSLKNDLNVDNGIESAVLDRDGRVLLGPPAWLDRPPAVPPDPEADPGLVTWPGEGEFLSDWERSPGGEGASGLVVLLRQPAALAFQPAIEMSRRLLLLGALGTAAFMLLSLWLAARVARPIGELSAAALRVVHDQPPQFAAIPPEREDEVAEVAHALRRLHDTLARRLAEQQLATARYETLFRDAPVAIYLAIEDHLLIANQACVRLFGAPGADALVGLDTAGLFHPDDAGLAELRLRQQAALEPGGAPTPTLEHRIRRLDGGIAEVESTAIGLALAEGRGVQVVLHDITEQRQAQAALRELNAQLEARVAARTAELQGANAELDAFAYAVSHDLRAPLRAMTGFSQALIEDHGAELPPPARGYLDQIVLAGQRMGDLVEGLLTLSRTLRGALSVAPVDLSALAEQTLADLRRAEPGREVAVEIEPGLVATGDRRMLAALVNNLVGNAWKYTAGCAGARIRVFSITDDGSRWICVEDNGAGFDMAHAGRLFKAFARLHRQDEFPGLGIGLATVQRIVNRHGGRIEAEGSPGRGARFRFTLPERPRAGVNEGATA